MGILKVEIDYAEVAAVIMESRNAAKNLMECCDKMQTNLDQAVFTNVEQGEK